MAADRAVDDSLREGTAIRLLAPFDQLLRKVLLALCMLLLAAMVLFTAYTVVMRTVFLDPPFWGDTIALFANIWLMMLAFALSIRERDSIAMQMIYDYLPRGVVRGLELVWLLLLIAVGLLMVFWGAQVALRIPGAYWELGNLPKSVPMLILPISGALVTLAGLFVLIEDLSGRRFPGGPRQETRDPN
ncbi:MAG: TRAP transporter small permease [Lautropia sp.]